MRIIAVDDEALALETLTDAITEAAPDAELHSFRDGKSAIEYVKDNPCDVAFLDIRLRGMTGLYLGVQLKSLCPSINIIFATGYDEYALDAMKMHCSGYILKPVQVEHVKEELANLRTPQPPAKSRIHAQTFGNFTLFLDGYPVEFETNRSKELLAYLVDRRGARVKNGEAAAVIWEENDNIASVQTQLRKAKQGLLSSLKKAGCPEILISGHNDMAVDTTKMSCDYWQLLENDVRVLNSFCGEYMSEYSWAEMTLAGIERQVLY